MRCWSGARAACWSGRAERPFGNAGRVGCAVLFRPCGVVPQARLRRDAGLADAMSIGGVRRLAAACLRHDAGTKNPSCILRRRHSQTVSERRKDTAPAEGRSGKAGRGAVRPPPPCGTWRCPGHRRPALLKEGPSLAHPPPKPFPQCFLLRAACDGDPCRARRLVPIHGRKRPWHQGVVAAARQARAHAKGSTAGQGCGSGAVRMSAGTVA